MQITLNGKITDIPDALSVTGLIEHLQLANRRVAVEINQEIVSRSQHHTTALCEGDTVELVTAIGGG